ncbi:MAG: hypothetical protein IK070_00660 [Clostridia bacterium]|nr:hypothetical protein [Clostridia bacterium]
MKIQEIFDTVKNLKFCEQELYYIRIIDIELNSFYKPEASDLIGEIVNEYAEDFYEIGSTISNRPLVTDEQAKEYYNSASDKDIKEDLVYARTCLIAISGKHMGLIKSYAEIAKELSI